MQKGLIQTWDQHATVTAFTYRGVCLKGDLYTHTDKLICYPWTNCSRRPWSGPLCLFRDPTCCFFSLLCCLNWGRSSLYTCKTHRYTQKCSCYVKITYCNIDKLHFTLLDLPWWWCWRREWQVWCCKVDWKLVIVVWLLTNTFSVSLP